LLISTFSTQSDSVSSTSVSASVAAAENGVVTALAAGEAVITVTTVDGAKTDSCRVTVSAPVPDPQPSTVHYVALGDSIATGTTSRGKTTSYVYNFYQTLKSKYPGSMVTMTNLSKDGDDSTDLLTKLRSDPLFIEEIKNADIITISIGGNNVLGAGENSFSRINHTVAEAGTAIFESVYASIIARIRELNTDAKIISSTLYNPYNAISISGYASDPDLHKQVEQYIDRINATISGITGDTNYKVADVYSSFLSYANGGKMGSITYFYPTSWLKFTRDPHPNQTGQNVITTLCVSALSDLSK
jgi:lysophospholipase L1-like esterase